MTQLQALEEALYLALSARDEQRATMAAELAIDFAEGLTPAQVDQAKAYALKAFIATGAA